MRVFNQREGFDSKDDILPYRFFNTPLKAGGPIDGQVVNEKQFLECREYYYELNGWDKDTGNPNRTKLNELGLEWTCD